MKTTSFLDALKAHITDAKVEQMLRDTAWKPADEAEVREMLRWMSKAASEMLWVHRFGDQARVYMGTERVDNVIHFIESMSGRGLFV